VNTNVSKHCCCNISDVGALTPACALPSCSGPIPQQWQNTTRPDINDTRLSNFVYDIDLSGNLLTGSLPTIIGGRDAVHTLRLLNLRRNRFTGRVRGHEPLIHTVKTAVAARDRCRR
jgi:hypothetical protein